MTLYAIASGAEFFGLYEAETMEKAICYALTTKGGYDGLTYDIDSDTLRVQGSEIFIDKLDGLYYDLKGMIDCSMEIDEYHYVYATDTTFVSIPEFIQLPDWQKSLDDVRYIDKATAIKVGA